MRLYALILFCGFLMTICAEPDPKKYKSEVKEKTKQTNTTLTAEEKKFLRDVEAKFGIQNDATKEEKKNKTNEKPTTPTVQPGHFPAVIAIEIVNDTDTNTKGKRTIDANLGYGYKTNNGYTYSYFGKPSQEKGKFMIYPYSQGDTSGEINSYHTIHHFERPNGKYVKTSVEIQPSQAFELVKVKEEQSGYNYEKPAIEFNTPIPPSYTSESNSYSSHPSTLYTTYNGEQFSGLSGQFPSVKSNYLVDPSQLIKSPDYQNVGLTQDYIRSSHLEQKVVPVLVLRIPSSSLNNPTAELYANLPHNYPLSNYLNNLNLQELVNQYFKKSGYSFAPQVMAYSSSLSPGAAESSIGSSVSQYDPQHYAHPYVQPSYTQSHTSGVQYSAVQPVMARYPSSYTRHHYTVPKGHTLYKQPPPSQKYEYQYQHVSQPSVSSPHQFYLPTSHYQQQTQNGAYEQLQNGHSSSGHSANIHSTNSQLQYEAPRHVSSGYETSITHDVGYGAPQANTAAEYATPEAKPTADYAAPQATPAADYGAPQANSAVEYSSSQAELDTSQAHAGADYSAALAQYQAEYGNSNTAAPEYGVPKDGYSQSLPAGYESSITASPSPYGSAKDTQAISQDYYIQSNQQPEQESHSGYASQVAQSDVSQSDINSHQNFAYQYQPHESSQQGLVLSENYPSKDHTIAAVYPAQYKAGKQKSAMVQTVSYVTPVPNAKYRMPYQVMVPQTYLHNPTSEKVSYVHAQPMSASYSQSGLPQDYNSGAEYTTNYHYTPSGLKQKPLSHIRGYRSPPKRMIHKNNKLDFKNKSDKNEKKKLS